MMSKPTRWGGSESKREYPSSWEGPWKVQVKVAQWCLTLCNSMDRTFHGILQARILEWVAFPSSRGSCQPRDRSQVPCIAGRFFTSWATWEAQIGEKGAPGWAESQAWKMTSLSRPQSPCGRVPLLYASHDFSQLSFDLALAKTFVIRNQDAVIGRIPAASSWGKYDSKHQELIPDQGTVPLVMALVFPWATPLLSSILGHGILYLRTVSCK